MRFTLITEEAQDAHVSCRGERNGVIRESLDRYFYLLADSRDAIRDRFTGPELSLLADACNGTLMEAWSIRLIEASIEDSIRLDHTDQKWGADGATLLEKLRALTTVEKFALADAIERFWQANTRGESVEAGELLTA